MVFCFFQFISKKVSGKCLTVLLILRNMFLVCVRKDSLWFSDEGRKLGSWKMLNNTGVLGSTHLFQYCRFQQHINQYIIKNKSHWGEEIKSRNNFIWTCNVMLWTFEEALIIFCNFWCQSLSSTQFYLISFSCSSDITYILHNYCFITWHNVP